MWLIYPETANRHLEDIDTLYRDYPDMVAVVRHEEATQVPRPQRFIDAENERKELLKQGTQAADALDVPAEDILVDSSAEIGYVNA